MPVGVAWISPSASASSSQVARDRAEPLRERGRALVVDVDDRRARATPRSLRRVRDRRARAAGAEHDDLAERRVRQAAPEALREPARVGVVADRAAVAEHDGVDGLQRRRLGRELVEVLDDVLLARVRDVEAAVPVAAGALEQLADAGVEPLDVEQPVAVLEAQRGGLAPRAGRGSARRRCRRR